MKRVFLLYGGIWGWDGAFENPGMVQLANRIKQVKDVYLTTHFWSSYASVANMILAQASSTKIALVGYSGGGSRVTWVANEIYPRAVDLMIGYDPSPVSDMQETKTNVKRGLCYHNNAPWMFGLGGGEMFGPNVEKVQIAEQHIMVQFDQALHSRTLAAIEAL